MEKKLSQIILYVDENIKNSDFWAFSTKDIEKSWKIDVKQHSYVNDKDIDIKPFCERRDDIFVITDSSYLCDVLAVRNIAFAGLIHEKNKNDNFRSALYLIEDLSSIDFKYVKRIWERFRDIPWTICESDRIIIREQEVLDVKRLYEIYADPDTTKYTEGLYPKEEDEIDYMKKYIANQYKFFEFGLWAIVDKNSGSLIGRAGISTRADFEELELGYVIAKEYRNKGYAKEACEMILQYAKEELYLEKIQAFTRKENSASVALLQSLGFNKIGNEIIDGTLHERYMLSLT